jgi:hypothetical protein
VNGSYLWYAHETVFAKDNAKVKKAISKKQADRHSPSKACEHSIE